VKLSIDLHQLDRHSECIFLVDHVPLFIYQFTLSVFRTLEVERARITSIAKQLPDAPSTSGFHLRDIWSYFKAFYVDPFPIIFTRYQLLKKLTLTRAKGTSKNSWLWSKSLTLMLMREA
jgi:hypothetical protein